MSNLNYTRIKLNASEEGLWTTRRGQGPIVCSMVIDVCLSRPISACHHELINNIAEAGADIERSSLNLLVVGLN